MTALHTTDVFESTFRKMNGSIGRNPVRYSTLALAAIALWGLGDWKADFYSEENLRELGRAVGVSLTLFEDDEDFEGRFSRFCAEMNEAEKKILDAVRDIDYSAVVA
jgi:hypothetical protein